MPVGSAISSVATLHLHVAQRFRARPLVLGAMLCVADIYFFVCMICACCLLGWARTWAFSRLLAARAIRARHSLRPRHRRATVQPATINNRHKNRAYNKPPANSPRARWGSTPAPLAQSPGECGAGRDSCAHAYCNGGTGSRHDRAVQLRDAQAEARTTIRTST